jgi:hypothetical protein
MTPLRILFLVQHSEHLRMFESGLTELAQRGHRLRLAFPPLEGRGTLVADRLAQRFPGVTVHSLPHLTRTRLLNTIGQRLRTVQDDLRYFQPRYAAFRAVRDEAEGRYPAPLRAAMTTVAARPHARARLAALLAATERRLPLARAARRFMTDHPADLVLASPLVSGPYLVDYVRLAQAAGIPTGLPVRSWDNLTTKGVLHVVPDGLIVWNDAQRQEAFDEFGVPPDRVAVVGAHNFDHWFGRTPSPRDQFCAGVGLSPDRPYLLYVASSRRIARDESAFVSRWIQALRAHNDPRVRVLQVLIRPHFQNPDSWQGWSPPAPGVVVSPPLGEMPVDDNSRRAFFDGLSHCVAAVGANTSAMIEAAIAGRPVLSILTPEFGQETMPHFHHLTDQGLIQTARSFDEHCAHVVQVLDVPGGWDAARLHFLRTFIRPHGLDTPAARHFANAVEALMRFSRVRQAR